MEFHRSRSILLWGKNTIATHVSPSSICTMSSTKDNNDKDTDREFEQWLETLSVSERKSLATYNLSKTEDRKRYMRKKKRQPKETHVAATEEEQQQQTESDSAPKSSPPTSSVSESPPPSDSTQEEQQQQQPNVNRGAQENSATTKKAPNLPSVAVSDKPESDSAQKTSPPTSSVSEQPLPSDSTQEEQQQQQPNVNRGAQENSATTKKAPETDEANREATEANQKKRARSPDLPASTSKKSKTSTETSMAVSGEKESDSAQKSSSPNSSGLGAAASVTLLQVDQLLNQMESSQAKPKKKAATSLIKDEHVPPNMRAHPALFDRRNSRRNNYPPPWGGFVDLSYNKKDYVDNKERIRDVKAPQNAFTLMVGDQILVRSPLALYQQRLETIFDFKRGQIVCTERASDVQNVISVDSLTTYERADGLHPQLFKRLPPNHPVNPQNFPEDPRDIWVRRYPQLTYRMHQKREDQIRKKLEEIQEEGGALVNFSLETKDIHSIEGLEWYKEKEQTRLIRLVDLPSSNPSRLNPPKLTDPLESIDDGVNYPCPICQVKVRCPFGDFRTLTSGQLPSGKSTRKNLSNHVKRCHKNLFVHWLLVPRDIEEQKNRVRRIVQDAMCKALEVVPEGGVISYTFVHEASKKGNRKVLVDLFHQLWGAAVMYINCSNCHTGIKDAIKKNDFARFGLTTNTKGRTEQLDLVVYFLVEKAKMFLEKIFQALIEFDWVTHAAIMSHKNTYTFADVLEIGISRSWNALNSFFKVGLYWEGEGYPPVRGLLYFRDDEWDEKILVMLKEKTETEKTEDGVASRETKGNDAGNEIGELPSHNV